MPTKRKTAARRARRKIATEGGVYSFHGAFKSRAKAAAKARKVGGFYKGTFTKARGDFRYVVMGPGSGVGF
jgi:hypothetical protein